MTLLARPGYRGLLTAVCLTAVAFSVNALWIPVKAEVAQFLLERAWSQTLAGATDAKPWPWADTRALAILEVPRLGIRQIVLEGSSGRNLAFGPALVNTSSPDDTGDLVLSGHRDTHFRFLQDLRNGDHLLLHGSTRTRKYRVAWQEVVDSRAVHMVIEDGVDRLTLVTCYPFDSPMAGGPLRWVVTAVPEG